MMIVQKIHEKAVDKYRVEMIDRNRKWEEFRERREVTQDRYIKVRSSQDRTA